MANRTKTEPPSFERHHVRNRSSRHGTIPQAVAIHTAETESLASVRSWFNNPSSAASSHIGIARNADTELWVPSNEKAWTIGALNSLTLNIELMGYAKYSADQWKGREEQLKQCARWCAYWCHKYDIPPRRGELKANGGAIWVHKRGIIRHSDSTALGFGSHTDPGRGFPMSRLLELLGYYYENGWTR